MKKNFIKPTVEIVKLDNHDIICTSTIGGGGNDSGHGSAESRGSWWGDEEW